MLNAFRHLTPSFIPYRGVKPGWKFWWRRDSRTIFSWQNQIESLSRPRLLCPISLESIRFRVMRHSKCIMTPGVTHLSFWEQPLVMERHVLHYEYKWADLSFSRNNWILYIYWHGYCLISSHIVILRPNWGPKNIFWRHRLPLPLIWSSGSSTGPYSMS